MAGHRGLVGSAIWNNMKSKGYTNLVGRTHAELDLLDAQAVKAFFDEERPEYVILAAAFVGGELPTSCEEAFVSRKHLHLSAGSAAAHSGISLVDLFFGMDQ